VRLVPEVHPARAAHRNKGALKASAPRQQEELVPLPPITPDQRRDALKRAGQVRAERASIKDQLKRGTLTLPEVIAQAAESDVVAKMKVTAVLEAMPGVGKVRAREIMARIGIVQTRRLRGLGANQRAALAEEFGAVPA
jgi:hypothetical protein